MNSIPVSMINEVMGVRRSETENIKVGMAATKFVGSDSYAMVVTEVISPKKIRVSHMMNEDYSTLNENDNDVQILSTEQMKKYVYVTDTTIIPIGEVYSYRKNYRWIAEGCGLWETGGIHLGHATEYRDPSF